MDDSADDDDSERMREIAVALNQVPLPAPERTVSLVIRDVTRTEISLPYTEEPQARSSFRISWIIGPGLGILLLASSYWTSSRFRAGHSSSQRTLAQVFPVQGSSPKTFRIESSSPNSQARIGKTVPVQSPVRFEFRLLRSAEADSLALYVKPGLIEYHRPDGSWIKTYQPILLRSTREPGPISPVEVRSLAPVGARFELRASDRNGGTLETLTVDASFGVDSSS